MIRITLVDNDAQAMANITNAISAQEDLLLQGRGKDSYDAIMLVKKFKPDIVLMDAALEFDNGVEITGILKRHSPSTAIVILSSRIEDRVIFGMARGTITSCLLLDTDMDSLVSILRLISQGIFYMSPKITARAFQILAEHFREKVPGTRAVGAKVQAEKNHFQPVNFSRAEFKILYFIAEGYSSKEIAKTLKLKEGTVRNYISRVMKKAGLKNRTQIALYAQQYGLEKKIFSNYGLTMSSRPRTSLSTMPMVS